VLAGRGRVRRLALSSDGRTLVAVNEAGLAQHWDLSERAAPRSVMVRSSSLAGLHATSDGRVLVAGWSGRALVLADALRGTVLTSREGHDDDVASLAFSSDGGRLFSASVNYSEREWDVTERRELRRYDCDPSNFTDPLAMVLHSPGGRYRLSL